MTVMKKISLMFRLRKAALSCLLVLMLGIGMTVIPVSPVHAQDQITDVAFTPATIITNLLTTIEDIYEGSSLAAIVSLFGEVYTMFGEMFDSLFETLAKVTRVSLLEDKATAATERQVGQAELDTRYYTEGQLGPKVEYAMEHPPSHIDQVCRAAVLQSIPISTKDFERGVSLMAAKAIDSMYRGPYDQGDGGMYSDDAFRFRCQYKFGNPIDGYPDECVDTATDPAAAPSSEHGIRPYVDADLSPFTMDGTITLELPDMVTEDVPNGAGATMKVVRPDPKNYAQHMWVAATNYCFTLAGPRPTPTWGEGMDTEKGRRERALFNQGLSMQSAYNKKCTDLIAYYTRPNASQAALRKQQNEDCSNAMGAAAGQDGIFSAETMEKEFNNCTLGLSPYQAEYLAHAVCKSPENLIAQGISDSKFFEMTDSTISCSASWNMWVSERAARHAVLLEAIMGQQEVKKIWQSIRELGGVSALPDVSTGTKFAKQNSGHYPSAAFHAVKASSFSMGRYRLLRGVPTYVDEISFPAAVAQ